MNIGDFAAFGVTGANVVIVYLFVRFLSNHLSKVTDTLAQLVRAVDRLVDRTEGR